MVSANLSLAEPDKSMAMEKAETGHLPELLSRLADGLDAFLKFEHPDALANRASWQSALDIPLPAEGVGIEQVTRELIDQIIPNGSPVTRPGFSGYIVTGAATASVLASTAASVASPARYFPTAFGLLEKLSLVWLAQMFGLGQMQGLYSNGGSVANLVALGAARQSAFEKFGVDPARDGVDRPVSVYASTECHHTIRRSGGVLGIGRRAVKPLACDKQGRMQVEALRTAIAEDRRNGVMPLAIVANAGTTNTGAIDPLAEIGEIAESEDIWFHVDGAYGLPGILDERLSALYEGLEMADSVIVDPHKWLGAAAGVAATFVHDRSILERAFTQEPSAYLEGTLDPADGEENLQHSMDDFGVPYHNYGVELTAPCRGVVVWALIREIGVEGLRQRIRRHNDMARAIAEYSRNHPNLELMLEPTLSICCFRFVSDQVTNLDLLNHQLCRRLIHENEFLPSTTRVNGQLALRPCYVGARAESDQVDGLLAAVLRIGDQLVSKLKA